MIKFLFKGIVTIILLAVIVVVGFFARNELQKTGSNFSGAVSSLAKTLQAIKNTIVPSVPCAKPISYSVGEVDPRFKISRTELQTIIGNAAAIWEKPVGLDLFELKEGGGGDLTINLIYDSRQESTNQLTKLGLQIENTKSSFDALKQKYENLKATYATAEKQFNTLVTEYNIRADKYEEEVNYWNKRGGAPENIFNKLETERQVLDNLADTLSAKQKSLNEMVLTINAFANVLNRLAKELNVSIGEFNTIGKEAEEFQEGVFIRDGSGEHIDIFEFATRRQLLRVLAHELGHALGLEHLENPQAIMYKRNQATNEVLTKDDLNALKRRCGLGE